MIKNNLGNNMISDGKKPLDNDTYGEFQNAHENNIAVQHDEIIRQWKRTNFWLGCIGVFFLIILMYIIVNIAIAIYVGKQVNDIFSTLSF